MANTVKKLISFPEETYKKITDYRFLNRKNTEREAVLELIDFGMLYRKEKFEKALKETFEEYDEVFRNLAKR